MHHLNLIVVLLTIIAFLSPVARRLRIPYPVLLVVAGLGLAFIPPLSSEFARQLSELRLAPDVVFFIFLPPLIFEAAIHISWQDFKINYRSIFLLGIGLTFVCATFVAALAHNFIAGFSWPLAFVLGAIVSPPDALVATSMTQGLGLPRRLVTSLQGEGLINDAAALIIYRYAVMGVEGIPIGIFDAALGFLAVMGLGIICGALVSLIFVWLLRWISHDATISSGLTLLVPFASYSIAESISASGVIAVVTAGLIISWRSTKRSPYQSRLRTKSIWDTVGFLLNGLVFILIGLELPQAFHSLSKESIWHFAGFGILLVSAISIVRFSWISLFSRGSVQPVKVPLKDIEAKESVKHATIQAKGSAPESGGNSRWKFSVIATWANMRGVVTIAIALGLPLTLRDGSPFPMRDYILLLSFMIVFITLVFQGVTLPLLIRILRLDLTSDHAIEDELRTRLARDLAKHLEEEIPEVEASRGLKAQRRALIAQRETLREFRASNQWPEEALRHLETQTEIEVANVERLLNVLK